MPENPGPAESESGNVYALNTSSEIRGLRAHTDIPAIDANYYNITDTDGNPTAGLLVLLDRRRMPVRAELHLYEEVEDALWEGAVRQARLLLEHRYRGPDPIPLRILQTYQERIAVEVPLRGTGGRATSAGLGGGLLQARQNWLLAAAGVVVALLIVWGLWALLRGGGPEEITQTPDAGPTVTSVAQATEGEAGAGAVAEDAAPAAEAAPTLVGSQTNNLPPSRNADPNLAVGMRVRMGEGYRAFLLDAPDAESGAQVGVMEAGQQGLILDGPVWRQGDADTIVWWYVRMDNGVEAWAPANTSQFTLLEAVE